MHAATLLQPLKTTLRVSPLYYDRGQQVVQWPQLLGWRRTGLRDAESIMSSVVAKCAEVESFNGQGHI